jgi:hypothetical protein
MPHSIFFTKKGHAIHGTDSVSRLGNPASHGCVRLSRANAAVLFALVKAEGVTNTSVTLSGSSQVALARGPQRRNDVAARAVNSQEPQVQMYDGTARTLPPPQQITPQVDNRGYYDEYGRPLPGARAYRRGYDADSNYPEQQPYAQQQPVNPYAPRPYGQQPYQPQYQQQPYQQQPYAGQTYNNPYYAQPRYQQRQTFDNYGY